MSSSTLVVAPNDHRGLPPWLLWGVVLLSATMLLSRLDQGMLMPDESESAVQAVSVLKHGVPLVEDDGSRIIPIVFRWTNKDGVWIHTPWIDEYLLAGSVALFGQSRWAARFPFALASLCTIFLFWPLARRYLRPDAASIALVLYALSAVLVGQGRMCRYYSLLHLGEVIFLHGIDRALRRQLLASVSLLVTGYAICFHANYVAAFSNVGGLGLWVLWQMRKERYFVWVGLGFVLGAVLASLPWLWYIDFKLFGHLASLSRYLGDAPLSSGPSIDPRDIANMFRLYLQTFDIALVPLAVVALAILIAIFSSIRRREAESWNGMIEFCVILSLFTLALAALLPIWAERYILFLLPNAQFLIAFSLSYFPSWPRRAVVVTLLCFSFIGHPARLWMNTNVDTVVHMSHFVTLVRSYQERNDLTVAEAIRQHSSKGELIESIGEEMPLSFMLPDRRFLCAEWADEKITPEPRLILSESLAGISPISHFVPLPKSLRKFYDPLEVEVDAADIRGPWQQSEPRPYIIYVRNDQPMPFARQVAHLHESRENLLDTVRGCWMAGPDVRLQPVRRGEEVEVAVVPLAPPSARVVWSAVRKEVFLRGGIELQQGTSYRVVVDIRGSVDSLDVSFIDQNDQPVVGAPAAREGERWTVELTPHRAVQKARILFQLKVRDEPVFLRDASVVSESKGNGSSAVPEGDAP